MTHVTIRNQTPGTHFRCAFAFKMKVSADFSNFLPYFEVSSSVNCIDKLHFSDFFPSLSIKITIK